MIFLQEHTTLPLEFMFPEVDSGYGRISLKIALYSEIAYSEINETGKNK